MKYYLSAILYIPPTLVCVILNYTAEFFFFSFEGEPQLASWVVLYCHPLDTLHCYNMNSVVGSFVIKIVLERKLAAFGVKTRGKNPGGKF